MTVSRRDVLLAAASAPLAALKRAGASERVHITSLEVISIPVNVRGNWVFVQLRAGASLVGLGEASHGARGPRETELERMRRALEDLFPLIRDKSPFDIEAFRLKAWPRARKGGLIAATAASALEQAMWDLAGKALGAPVYELLGGKLRDRLPLYANVNRATNERSPEEFAANAAKAVEEGFRAVKAAPFDDFPPLQSPPEQLEAKRELGLRRIEAMRRAIGPGVDLLVDCHSHFDRALSIEVARRLEPVNLYWYEEPVPPEHLDDTAAIKAAVKQKMAGGEVLFGVEGFEPLCRRKALDVIMPDVKHCGGILEGRKIAAVADVHGVVVSPHNPAGPVSTAASAQLCAGLANFGILEYAWGEVDWRRDLIDPTERITGGALVLSDRPGLGVALNQDVLRRRG
jgi:galactonate dehydratase